jgi:PAS domain S-box-containing protein
LEKDRTGQLADDVRLALFAEAEQIAQLGSWAWHIADNSVYWSDGLFRILGLDQAKVEASTEAFFAAIHPDDLPALQEASAKMAETGETHVRRVRIVRPDGSVRSIRMTSAQVRGEDGAPLRLVGTLLDITEKLEDEAQLESTLERLREAQRIANVGSWTMNLKSLKIEWSEQMYRITGLDPEGHEPDVKSFYAMIHPEDRRKIPAFSEVPFENSPLTVELRLVRPNGEVRHVALASHAGSQGGLSEIHGTMVDVTERKQLEEQLHQSQKMEALGKLAGAVAHDLNNYLQIISGNLELLEPEPLQEDSLEPLQDIHASLRLCSSLTRGLLAFSRQQSGEAQNVDLHDVLQASTRLVAKLLGPDIKLELELAASSAVVFIDSHQLEQVFVNLVINARDAMGGKGALTIKTENVESVSEVAQGKEKQTDIVVAISDTGYGIAESHLEKVFEPFFTTKEEGHGTGLGLSTVYGIVRRNGGKVRAESVPARGATFFVQFPVVAHELDPQKKAADASSVAASVEAKNAGVRPSVGRTILVVEDEPMVRRMASTSLRQAGYSVLEAEDGRAALDLIEHTPNEGIDLILSDVVMPRLGGAELVKTLRGDGVQTPVVLMTGYAEQEELDHEHVALCPIVTKPFRRQELLAAIVRVLSGA